MRALVFGGLVLVAACGNGAPPGSLADGPASVSPSAAAPPTAAQSTSATALETDAGAPSLRPSRLLRKTTPRARRLADERGCEAGPDGGAPQTSAGAAASCRRAADRYRGYGHVAGCGVDRERPEPRREVSAADARGDARLFDRWIRRACDLGDEDACIQGKNNVASWRIAERDADACARSALSDCPLYQWVAGVRPDKAKAVEVARRQFMAGIFGGKLFGELYRKEKTRGGDVLPPALAAVAAQVCRTTLECDDVLMMLDKDGYTPAALAPLRLALGESLATACLEGSCVCGEAARYLDPADARLVNLARMGCADGEPDGCFALGDLYERGAGVEKSAATAFALYAVACPSELLAADGREEGYSKAACARLAERYEEGQLLEKDVDRAFFYASHACTRGGFERDHAPCLRRGRLHAQLGFKWRSAPLYTPQMAAHEFFFGTDDDPVNGKECERPSVEAQCQREAGLVH